MPCQALKHSWLQKKEFNIDNNSQTQSVIQKNLIKNRRRLTRSRIDSLFLMATPNRQKRVSFNLSLKQKAIEGLSKNSNLSNFYPNSSKKKLTKQFSELNIQKNSYEDITSSDSEIIEEKELKIPRKSSCAFPLFNTKNYLDNFEKEAQRKIDKDEISKILNE